MAGKSIHDPRTLGGEVANLGRSGKNHWSPACSTRCATSPLVGRASTRNRTRTWIASHRCCTRSEPSCSTCGAQYQSSRRKAWLFRGMPTMQRDATWPKTHCTCEHSADCRRRMEAVLAQDEGTSSKWSRRASTNTSRTKQEETPRHE